MMGLIRRGRLAWRSWRLSLRLKKNSDLLREFVYLDDISVYSLLSSKSGAIPTDFTDKVTRTFTGELSGSNEVTMPTYKESGAFKAGISYGTERQVARKAIVQSTFRDLRKGLNDEIVFLPRSQKWWRKWGRRAPVAVEGLAKKLDLAVFDGHTYRADKLERGKIFELRVQLEADNLFQAGTVIDVMAELVEELPAGLRPNISDFNNATALSKMLDKLLVGLVPIRCRVVDFRLVQIDGVDWIVHDSMLSNLPPETSTRPLYVVGVTERQLYWRDLRRVVFSGLPMQIMARVATPGVLNSWSAVKLSDVMTRFSPEFSSSMSLLEAQMRSSGIPAPVDAEAIYQQMLIRYGREYSEAIGLLMADDLLASIDEAAYQGRSVAVVDDFDRQVESFEAVESAVRRHASAEDGQLPSRELAVALRSSSLAQFQSDLQAAGASSARQLNGEHDDACYIDCEVVAIYW